MSDHTIAEIIGWEWLYVASAAYVPYTVDDLLTWLADKGWCTDIERLIDHETPVFVTLRSNRHRDIFDLPMFTTALAACEAAVRAVAEMP